MNALTGRFVVIRETGGAVDAFDASEDAQAAVLDAIARAAALCRETGEHYAVHDRETLKTVWTSRRAR